MTTLPSATRPSLGALLGDSWGVLRAHPVIAGALGAAVVFSLASMLFGIGVLSTPWFICEIFALQLAVLTDRRTIRGVSWIRAGVFVLGLVGVVVAAAWITALAVGPDVTTADSASNPLPWPEALRRAALVATATALAVGFIAPFIYAPLILIERGGTAGAAALESAWLVRRGGLIRHWVLAFAAHLLPMLPALIAAVAVARTIERAATPVGVLLGLPLLPLTIPLGQGLLTAAYVRRRGELSEPRWARREGRPPRALVAVLIGLVIVPVLSVSLLALGALRAAPPLPGMTLNGRVVVECEIERPRVIPVPDTTLTLLIDGSELVVRAGDGAEVRPRNPGGAAIDRVRVRRRGELYAIEVHAGDWWVLEVDRAAMRTDDSVGARLDRRLPAWGLPSIAIAFALSALLLVRALEPLGEIRRLYGAPRPDRPPVHELRRRRRRATQTAWVIAAALTVPTALALSAGLIGLFG